MKTKISLAIISFLFAALLIATSYAAIKMILFSDLTVQIMGGALFLLCLIGFWGGIREFIFGLQSDRVLRRYLSEGYEPKVWSADIKHSGRVSRESARTLLDEYVKDHPVNAEDWRVQLELGMMTAAAGDTAQGRKHTRLAIELSKI